jgi:UDP-N-acetylmuramoylalanine--D-glutamate ligase
MHVIVGTGKTGLSVARFLARSGIDFVLFDTRDEPPAKNELLLTYGVDKCLFGSSQVGILNDADVVVVSPGIDLRDEIFSGQDTSAAHWVSDIDLFVTENNKFVAENNKLPFDTARPVVGITGSNGKSTVTTLVGELLAAAGLKVAVGGNIGIPVLDLLEQPFDVAVLELSSFQLDITRNLPLRVATILNVTEDHMDRYPSMEAYRSSKQRIYQQAEQVVINADDQATNTEHALKICYGHDPRLDWFIESDSATTSICGRGYKLDTGKLHVKGMHNWSNVMAALAICQALNIDLHHIEQSLLGFTGLPHRCQWVASVCDMDWLNDSKATNPGATLAAISGLAGSYSNKAILIAGGDSKGAELSVMASALAEHVGHLIVFGRDAHRLAAICPDSVELSTVNDLDEAVRLAAARPLPGGYVLLSPACASLDMYPGFEARGQHFIKLVQEVAHAAHA